MRAAYTGTETLTFSQYMDTGTGRTLAAEPGGIYEIMPASGHVVPEIPTGWFVPVDEEGHPAPDMWPATPEAEPEPEQEPAEG